MHRHIGKYQIIQTSGIISTNFLRHVAVGRQLIKQSELIINMQAFQNGVYLVKIQLDDNQHITKRII